MGSSILSEAVGALYEDRQRHLCSHPTLDELSAYHQRALTSDRLEVIAEHLADCEDCTILLLYGVIGRNGNEDRSEGFDADLEEVWRQLQPQLGNGSWPGRSLSSLRGEGPLPIEVSLPIILEASLVLAELHAKGRVLTDLRAENVFVSDSGQVHLYDLGLIPIPEADGSVGDMYRSLSPEQVAMETLDQRSNLFSFGVLLYEMLTGESPFRGSTPLGTASRILSLDPLLASELNPAVDPKLSALVDRLLAKDPEDRPPSAAAAAHEIAVIVDGSEPLQLRAEPAESVAIEDQIESLYDRIIVLSREEPKDESTRNEIERAYARLLELQAAEAKQFRERFEASLDMPIDAGEQILARARALRAKLEGLASSDTAAHEADASQASAQAV